VVFGEASDDFTTTQLSLINGYRARLTADRPDQPRRVALGRVIVPTDSAGAAARERYRQYAASRYERTLAPQGERRVLFAPDLVGSAEQIVEWLHADPVLAETNELRLELPYEFTLDDYRQILHDTVDLVAPQLGWRPAAVPAR